jgi:acyl-CoA thioesterase FadM
MSTIEQSPVGRLLQSTTNVELRPRYEGSNICTWIGFKHVNYLVEEAVLEHFRSAGLAARDLYETNGLGLDIVRLDTRIMTALHMDDLVRAEVSSDAAGRHGERSFLVTLYVEREGCEVKAAVAGVTVALRIDRWHQQSTAAVPAGLEPFVVEQIGPPGMRAEPSNSTNGLEHPGDGPLSTGRGSSDEADPLIARLTADENAFGWSWRIPYIYCHFTERMQMSGYLRQMEEVVDRFLAERGISIWELLSDRRWIPVVPHSRIEILAEALMEEELYTVYTVERIFKDLTYTSRMDCYVVRGGELLKTATGLITHGYARIDSRRDWSLVSFDERVVRALGGGHG